MTRIALLAVVTLTGCFSNPNIEAIQRMNAGVCPQALDNQITAACTHKTASARTARTNRDQVVAQCPGQLEPTRVAALDACIAQLGDAEGQQAMPAVGPSGR